jgi:hypothetical protein
MALEHSKFDANKLDSQSSKDIREDLLSGSLTSSSLGDIRRLTQSNDSIPGPAPNGRIGEQGEMLFCKAPVKDETETREQRLDKKIKDSFGTDVFDHLKDSDWLIDNRKKLEDGFKKLKGDDAWDLAWRMKELSVVDGKSLIYLSKVDSHTSGSLIPKRYDILLRRGRFRSDDYIGHVSH